MSTYAQGQTVQLGPQIVRDSTGLPVAADTQVITVVDPAGVPTVLTSTGNGGEDGYTAQITVETAGVWSYEWVFAIDDDTAVHAGEFLVNASPNSPRTAFASAAEVAARLGRTFTDAEGDQVDMLLQLASLTVAGACDKDAGWVATLETVPPIVRVITIECVVRAFVNPDGARTRQEQLGQYGQTVTYAAAAPAGVSLSAAEERAVRSAVFGGSTGSTRLSGVLEDIIPGTDDLPDTTG